MSTAWTEDPNPSNLPEACIGCPRCTQAGEFATFIPPTAFHAGTRLVVWGEMGGADEEQLRVPFVGRSGNKLRALLRKLGLRVNFNDYRQLEEAMFTNTVLCRHGTNIYPHQDIAQECLRRHPLPLGAGELPWLAVGANAVEALTGFRLPILRARGSILPVRGNPDKWLTCSFHPAFLVRGGKDAEKGQTQLEPLLALDAQRAMRCTQSLVPTVMEVEPEEMWEAFKADQSSKAALDIEGGNGQPTLVGLSWEFGRARVMRWVDGAREVTQEIVKSTLLTLHSAPYDIPELGEAGIFPPKEWVDTINLAALYDPSLPLNLENQVLTHVPGSLTWKKLVKHGDPDSEEKIQRVYRDLWREVLGRLGREIPENGHQWYVFYNGLDVAWDFMLEDQLRIKLERQGRLAYFDKLMQPLQTPLLDMGLRGLPKDPTRLARHQQACLRLRRMADKIVQGEGNKMLEEKVFYLKTVVDFLRGEREAELAWTGKRAFSKAEELSKATAALRAAKEKLAEGFSLDSPQQKAQLVAEWLGLPLPKTEKGNTTTRDLAMEELLGRMTKVDYNGEPSPTVKIKKDKGLTQEEAVRIVRAIVAGTRWSHWERTFLR